MKIIIIIGLIITLAVGGYLGYRVFAGEVYSAEEYTPPEGGYINTEISQIRNSPENYINKKISLKGTIDSECPTGCWFYLKDQEGNTIKIELAYSNFAIPQRVGRSVIVDGFPVVENDSLVIMGERVRIK